MATHYQWIREQMAQGSEQYRQGDIHGSALGSLYRAGEQIKRHADARPASPVECELNRLADELARLEGVCHSLVSRLEPVTASGAAGQACGNAPYDGCQIGARINGSATRVRDAADQLDALLSALQV